MSTISFQSIQFQNDKDRPDSVRLVFMRIYEMFIDKERLENIGKYRVIKGALEFPYTDQTTLNRKFAPLLDRAFHNLQCTLTKRKAFYIHQNSGIPLLGCMTFGIVDRGTNMIELKPLTGCNLDCTFCSVDEGTTAKKFTDYIVEKDYLIQETKKLIDYKLRHREPDKPRTDLKLDIFINPHGEPLLYADIVSLVEDLRKIKEINTISIITNGSLLTEELADQLIDAGLNQLNISVNAMDSELAKKLSGNRHYNIYNVLKICRHMSKRLKLIIAPVWMKKINNDEIPKIIEFAKDIGAEIGIQNYLLHKRGRKTAKQVPWEEFYAQLKDWEKEHSVQLIRMDHTISKTATMSHPFKKGDKLSAEIIAPGRKDTECIATARGRSITVVNCDKTHGRIKLRILKDKDNIFMGEPL